MFIPYHAEVAVERFPTSNLIIMGFTARTYLLVLTGLTQAEFFFLDGINSSLISHGFMHGSLSHLIGNMFYLWLFGNAICSRVNNPSYPAIYILLIIVAGLTHLIYDGDPAIGASGAVNGVMGMYLFLYPASKIKCVWTFRMHLERHSLFPHSG
ncbi:rhomboid family intramembrane serine protease [Candidatus Reidiella endopervernicosa]|uniref:Rhomboid family intramembrane serine protease n=2 Tax=Candidatus Reidiella endopervernicosa TaxID=2738883 RepID=A0A6N0HZE9_9GAMM|nr:rhomboid family intramembrane serine protease [Candidatus Reidiella endopervernicosa]